MLAVGAGDAAAGEQIAAGQILLKGAVRESIVVRMCALDTPSAQQQAGALVDVVKEFVRQPCIVQIGRLFQQRQQVAAQEIGCLALSLPVGIIGDTLQHRAQLALVHQQTGQARRHGNPLVALPALQQHAYSLGIQAGTLTRQAHLTLVDDGHGGQQHGIGGQFAQVLGQGRLPQMGRLLLCFAWDEPSQLHLSLIPGADKIAHLVLVEGRRRVLREAGKSYGFRVRSASARFPGRAQ